MVTETESKFLDNVFRCVLDSESTFGAIQLIYRVVDREPQPHTTFGSNTFTAHMQRDKVMELIPDKSLIVFQCNNE